MEITNIKIEVLENRQSKLRGYAKVTLNDVLIIQEIRIIEGNKGLFISMPSRKVKEEFVQVVYSKDKLFHEALTMSIIEEYKKELKKCS